MPRTATASPLNEVPRLAGSRKYCRHWHLIAAEWHGLSNCAWDRGFFDSDAQAEGLAVEACHARPRLLPCLVCYAWITDRF
jgi:hypothetical protein